MIWTCTNHTIKNTAYFSSDTRTCFNRRFHIRGTRRAQRTSFLHKKRHSNSLHRTFLNPISQLQLLLSTVNTDPHLSRPTLGSTQPPVQLVPGLSRGKERPGRDADPSPPASAVVKKRVELYLYSPLRPYGLYRASVPVQGCTFTVNTEAQQRTRSWSYSNRRLSWDPS